MNYIKFANKYEEIIGLLPVNCRSWRITKIKDTYTQRFVKVKEYNTSTHQVLDYHKIITPLKLV